MAKSAGDINSDECQYKPVLQDDIVSDRTFCLIRLIVNHRRNTNVMTSTTVALRIVA